MTSLEERQALLVAEPPTEKPERRPFAPNHRSYGPKRRKNGLSDKHRKFADHFLKYLNSAAAARYAGYSEKNAGVLGWQLLNMPKIEAYIREQQARQAAELKLTPQYVLARLHELAQKCSAEVPVLDRHGKPTGEYRLDSAGAKGALELIGKYLGMFGERIDHTLTVRVEDLTEAQTMALLGRVTLEGHTLPAPAPAQAQDAAKDAPEQAPADDSQTDVKP